jgi:hypothetical protein
MLVWRLNLAWKSGHPNQCLRLGDDAKTDRTLRARFCERASYGSPLSVRAKDAAVFLRNKNFNARSGRSAAVSPHLAQMFRSGISDMGQRYLPKLAA